MKPYLTEALFRASYRDVQRKSIRCTSCIEDDQQCPNLCEFLISYDHEAIDDNEGFPPTLGIGSIVEIPCWGGNEGEETFAATCTACGQRRQ